MPTPSDDAAQHGLSESDADPNPFAQFQQWYQAAVEAELSLPNAMTLATVTREGRPSARFVLLKGFDEQGFVFYTNYESRKGRDLAENPYAALVFYWDPLHRQVRVTGRVRKVTREESEQYFHSRPAGSQLSAAVSRQSTVIPDRQVLESTYQELAARYGEAEAPLPSYWGGYRVAPDTIEFWQGRANRLHDRLLYTRQPDDTWRIERLSP